MEIYAQFTDDVGANQSIQCGRVECGRAILPGETRHLIKNKNSNGHGRTVCDDCRIHYLSQSTTLTRRRTSSQQPISEQAQDVRRQVIDARSKDATRSQRRVTALPDSSQGLSMAYAGSILPPPVPGHPRIDVPSSWRNSMAPSAPYAHHHTSYGYSQAHPHYPSAREMWAKKAYQGTGQPDEQIRIIMEVMRKISGQLKGKLVENLSEGKIIPADSTPSYIINLVIEKMKPKLHWSSLVIRDVSSWTDLSDEDPHRPYYYDRCLLKSTSKSKDKSRVFKRPQKPFQVALVIDSKQWEEYLDNADDETPRSGPSSGRRSSVRSSIRSRRSVSSTHSGDIATSKLATATWDTNDNVGNNTPGFYGSKESEKRQRTISLARNTTPPPSKRRTIPAYVSPDHNQFRQALAAGGSSAIILASKPPTSERIEFFQLNNCALQELLQTTKPGAGFFTCDPHHAFQGGYFGSHTHPIYPPHRYLGSPI
ncbi:hypothetical protein C8R43DRAFT_954171 [Mycena crocata]|nr:hypothetical protein C8R43DRAFT_954171 [Mycena crocata]